MEKINIPRSCFADQRVWKIGMLQNKSKNENMETISNAYLLIREWEVLKQKLKIAYITADKMQVWKNIS